MAQIASPDTLNAKQINTINSKLAKESAKRLSLS